MGEKIPGYGGYILEVDLSEGNINRQPLDEELIKEYIGGKGFASKILYDELPSGIEPLSSDNMILFANGPLTGTLAPTSARSVLSTKSPLTGIWLDSNCGGSFGPELKFAGIDLLKIKGKAKTPKYLLIEDSDITLIDADDIWGFDTFKTKEFLHQRHPGTKVACIGPSGEKMIPLACVQAEGRSYGRGGGGAVLGSKNLKAIVVKGNEGISVYDHNAFVNSCREAFGELMLSSDSNGSRPIYGTSCIYSFIQEAGVLPIQNFKGSAFPGMERINEHSLLENLYEGNRACFACPIICSKHSLVKGGKYKGVIGEGPEYENVWSFGPQCGNSNLGSILKAEYLCDYYGLDAISTGNVIGFLMECYEKKLIPETEIGFNASFGNDEAIIKLVQMISKKEGIGELLGKGVAKAAKEIKGGSEQFAMHVKGLELPAYDPRGAVGMGLAYATSDRGACHLRAYTVSSEILDSTARLDPLTAEYKAELVKIEQDWFSILDSIGICIFANFGLNQNQLTKLLHTLTGIKEFSSLVKLLTIGEKIYNLTRLFNCREGLKRDSDMLPYRLIEEESPHISARNNTVPLDEMLNEYYFIRGWNKEGIPTSEKINELGLKCHEFEN